MKALTLLLSLTILLSCSNSDSKKMEENVTSDDLDFVVDTLETPEENIIEKEISVKAEEISDINQVEINPINEIPLLSDTIEKNYIVSKDETLMMIAFKIFGDYRKWQDLKAWNSELNLDKLHVGMRLKYLTSSDENQMQLPSGLPHLVKSGETLGIISMDKYGTSKKWKQIYEHNRPLIRDPDLIFAGFTLYYEPMRDLASEK